MVLRGAPPTADALPVAVDQSGARAGVSRRALLRAGGAVGTIAATGGVQLANAPAAAATTPLALSTDLATHLLRRVTYGPTPALLAEVRTTGYSAWIEKQLNPAAIADPTCDQILALFPDLKLSAQAVKLKYGSGDVWKHLHELRAATIVRAVWSKRQLFEVMAEHWTNHFTVYPGDEPEAFCKSTEDREVIRRHALGRFADLLTASATSPAMLGFLDNAFSSADNINENYGRELLELHTVGVDGGYTEADVQNAAKALTGWTIDSSTLKFRYDPAMRYVGPLRVMGWSHANADRAQGVAIGKSLLSYLARHPATAKHLAHKLATRFVSDAPSAALVDALAKTYLASGTDIKPVLRQLLGSAEFKASSGKKLRRPLEAMAMMLRATASTYDITKGAEPAGQLDWRSGSMGQSPMGWHPPDGYPDIATPWLGTSGMLGRWNFALTATGGWVAGIVPKSPTELAGGAARPRTAGGVVDAITQRLALQKFAPAHRAALLRAVDAAEGDVMSDDELRWRGRDLVALVLSSPYLQVR